LYSAEISFDLYRYFTDHADIKVTDKYYVDFKLDSVRRKLDEISLDDFWKMLL
jgi:hypothetical protein